MPESWETSPFGSLYLEPSLNGINAPSKVRGSGTRLVNMREIFAFDRINDQDMELAPLPDRKWLIREDDLLFARQSLVRSGAGRCVLVEAAPQERTFESHIIRVRLDPDLADARFFFYLFRSTVGRNLVASIVNETAAAGIRASDLARLLVPVPDITVQRRIAEALDAFDRHIAANERTMRAIEDLISTFFEAEEFDVPGDAVLGDLVSINPRRTKPAGEAAYIDMAGLSETSAGIARVGRRPASGGARFVNGDTLMARITPCLENGKIGFVDCLAPGEVGVGSTEFIVLRSEGDFPLEWSYFLARSGRFRDHVVRHMTGTSGRQRCPADVVVQYPIATPDLVSLSRFAQISGPLMTAMGELRREANVLAGARDALLPLLMSGAIRVGGRAAA